MEISHFNVVQGLCLHPVYQSFEKYWSGVGASHFKNVGEQLEPFIFKDAGMELELEP